MDDKKKQIQVCGSGVKYYRLKSRAIQIVEFPLTEGSKGLLKNGFLLSVDVVVNFETGELCRYEDIYLKDNAEITNTILSSCEKVSRYTVVSSEEEFKAYQVEAKKRRKNLQKLKIHLSDDQVEKQQQQQ